jgi:hypothetical protein
MHCAKQRRQEDSFPAIQDALLAFFSLRIEMSRHLIAHGFRSKRYFSRRGAPMVLSLKAPIVEVWRQWTPVGLVNQHDLHPDLGLFAVSSLHARDLTFLILVFRVCWLPKIHHEAAAMAKPGNSSMMPTPLSYACLHCRS